MLSSDDSVSKKNLVKEIKVTHRRVSMFLQPSLKSLSTRSCTCQCLYEKMSGSPSTWTLYIHCVLLGWSILSYKKFNKKYCLLFSFLLRLKQIRSNLFFQNGMNVIIRRLFVIILTFHLSCLHHLHKAKMN